MVKKEDFDKLNAKYQRLLEESRNVHRVLNLIGTHVPHLVFERVNKRILYFKQIGGIVYLNSNNEMNCMVCGKDRKTTAHHLVQRRAKCKNSLLRELRIRICKTCDKLVHPENEVFRNGHIKRFEDRIDKLKSEKGLLEEKLREVGVKGK